MLLDRYGIVSREMVSAEGLPGGFGPVYKVLSALEEAGRVRRGYFVEGLSGAQFARPGTVDMLRTVRPPEDPDLDVEEQDMAFVPAIDPANPWGSLLPWPETGQAASSARPRRVAGAWVLLSAGEPLLYLGANGRQLITFSVQMARPGVAARAFAALHRMPRTTRRGTLIVEKIDGQVVADSVYREAMLRSGFVSDYRGLAAEAFA
jgi:ATP-dependent Lhr-like helicase